MEGLEIKYYRDCLEKESLKSHLDSEKRISSFKIHLRRYT